MHSRCHPPIQPTACRGGGGGSRKQAPPPPSPWGCLAGTGAQPVSSPHPTHRMQRGGGGAAVSYFQTEQRLWPGRRAQGGGAPSDPWILCRVALDPSVPEAGALAPWSRRHAVLCLPVRWGAAHGSPGGAAIGRGWTRHRRSSRARPQNDGTRGTRAQSNHSTDGDEWTSGCRGCTRSPSPSPKSGISKSRPLSHRVGEPTMDWLINKCRLHRTHAHGRGSMYSCCAYR